MLHRNLHQNSSDRLDVHLVSRVHGPHYGSSDDDHDSQNASLEATEFLNGVVELWTSFCCCITSIAFSTAHAFHFTYVAVIRPLAESWILGNPKNHVRLQLSPRLRGRRLEAHGLHWPTEPSLTHLVLDVVLVRHSLKARASLLIAKTMLGSRMSKSRMSSIVTPRHLSETTHFFALIRLPIRPAWQQNLGLHSEVELLAAMKMYVAL
jgi:hypothetical protein